MFGISIKSNPNSHEDPHIKAMKLVVDFENKLEELRLGLEK